MKRFLAAAVLAALAFMASPAQSAQLLLCAPDPNPGARTIGGPGSGVPSGTLYQLNARGCALIQSQDAGFFQAQGFGQTGNMLAIQYTTGVLTGTTSVQIATIPPGAYIRDIIIDNLTTNAVTGGINIGNAASGAQVVAAATCGAQCITMVAETGILIRAFSRTAGQPLFATAATAWNSANVTFTIMVGFW